jgi:hypothetical protein
MGIVRRCGRPPRPAPLIQKSPPDRAAVRLAPIAAAADGAIAAAVDPPRATSRELEAAATARIAAIAFTGGGADRHDRRPRIPAIPGGPLDRRGDTVRDLRACDEVICSCRDHASATAE